ncbi:PfkB family carbohydrate kinase [Microbacterium sp. Marseille-Q6965]|uniref:PfkB family carbohydrate kinase n=1 Tax=Microbacterium sp. Marseille-Q6965 TaxID=2965072 RepID=UPI0021B7E0A6|nr:PfkB family carbohydrate kinase [Microbacterium sp. Marseille-Q6965]
MDPIVVVGDALIDEIRDDAGVREFVGGAALNVAVGLARLGAEATLIAMVGDDGPGERIRDFLAEHGVRLIASPSPLGTARAVSTRVGGEPQYVFNEAARNRHISFDAAARDAVTRAPLVAVSCVALDSPGQVTELARTLSDARLAIDPNPREGMMRDRAAFVDGFSRLAAGAALVKVGADDAALLGLGSVDDLARRLRRDASAVLATRGSGGATILAGERELTRPIADLPGPIVDTMGAGDAMFASFVAALAADPHPDWAGVLDRALRVAAATCRAEGALLRLP